MKKITYVATTALALVSAASAFAQLPQDPCAGVDLAGEIQIIPLDNSTDVYGRQAFLKQVTGCETNPLTIKSADAQGWQEIVITENCIIPKLGEIMIAGRVKMTRTTLSCFLQFKDAFFANGDYKITSRMPNGNLILEDSSILPTLLLKKIK